MLGYEAIENDMIIINKNEYVMVLDCSLINMKSKNETEVQKTIGRFKETVNGLRISHQWRRINMVLDIHDYVQEMKSIKQHVDPIRAKWINPYIGFIEKQKEEKKMMESELKLIIGYRVGQETNEVDRSTQKMIKDVINSFIPKKNFFKSMDENEKMQEVSEIFKGIEDDLKESLKKIRSGIKRLKTDELETYMYKAYRREMAVIQRWEEVPINGIPLHVEGKEDEHVKVAQV